MTPTLPAAAGAAVAAAAAPQPPLVGRPCLVALLPLGVLLVPSQVLLVLALLQQQQQLLVQGAQGGPMGRDEGQQVLSASGWVPVGGVMAGVVGCVEAAP